MRNNIILIWMPWSWKSTIWKYLKDEIWRNFIDVDDYIEEKNNTTVWFLLKSLWEEEFLEFEKNTVLSLNIKNSIISCTWSNPLKEKAIKYLKTIWYIIYIDVPLEIIKERLHKMKVDRIVWMANWKMTLDEILEYRKQFYERSFDYRFTINKNMNKRKTFSLFLDFFKTLPFCDKLDIKFVNE